MDNSFKLYVTLNKRNNIKELSPRKIKLISIRASRWQVLFLKCDNHILIKEDGMIDLHSIYFYICFSTLVLYMF